jgi:hypothetical protein
MLSVIIKTNDGFVGEETSVSSSQAESGLSYGLSQDSGAVVAYWRAACQQTNS